MALQFSFSKPRFVIFILLVVLAAFLLFAGGYVIAAKRSGTPVAQTGSGESTGSSGAGSLASSNGVYLATQAAPGLAANPAAQAALNPSAAANTQVGAAMGKLPPVIGTNPLATQAAYAATNSATNAVMNAGSSSSPSSSTSTPAASQAAPAGTAPAQPGTPVAAATPTAPGTAAAVPAAQNAGNMPYVLQFGAFREQKAAKVLQTTLKEKGLATTILNMVDNDQRTWHMVRFGNFKDLDSASKAASDISEKEGLQALVKRFDSL